MIVLPYTWNLLQLTRPQASPSPDELFGRPTRLYLSRQVSPNPIQYNLAGYYIGLNGAPLNRAGERFRDLRFTEYRLSFPYYVAAPSVKPVTDLDFAFFEALLLGLLLDVIAYDRQVINEIQQSKLLVRNLLGFGQPRVVLPF